MWQEVGSLIPELSRGDFVLKDLIEMEKELVHSLTWLMNPATAQSIAMHIIYLLPSDAPTSTLNDFASTALFFSELSVCDYYFVTSRKSVVAIAAVLNASESAGFGHFESIHGTIESLLSDTSYLIDWHAIASARERLWHLYKQSSESAPVGQHEDSSIPRRKPIHDSSPQLLQGHPSPTSCIDYRIHGHSDNSR